jgi:hypothetical protein
MVYAWAHGWLRGLGMRRTRVHLATSDGLLVSVIVWRTWVNVAKALDVMRATGMPEAASMLYQQWERMFERTMCGHNKFWYEILDVLCPPTFRALLILQTSLLRQEKGGSWHVSHSPSSRMDS